MNHRPKNPLAGIALLAIGLSLALAVVLIAFQTVRAASIRYATPAAQGSGDCSSWNNACSLQTALAGASSGDEIWVKAGVHYPGSSRTDSFAMRSGVALYGGFAGAETSREQRDWAANVTVLSGDIDQNDLTDPNGVVTDTAHIIGVNVYHVVTGSGTDSTAVLDGFVITAGQANGIPYTEQVYGAGMYNNSGSPTLNNIIFSGNTTSNTNGSFGGGMYNQYQSNPTLTHVTFVGNLGWSGGGMYNYNNCNPTLTDVTFSGNIAEYEGGGMRSTTGSTPLLKDVVFSGNSANRGSGMHNEDRVSPTLINVIFSNNSAEDSGGGMTIRGSSHATLINVTFSDNMAGNYGGGIFNDLSSNPMLTNVILWGNIAPNGAGIYNSSGTPQIAYSDVQGCGGSSSWNSACGADGGGNIEADPLLVDAANGNLRLQDNSPAINTGNNAALPPGVLTDLDGNPRLVRAFVDMGAYENQAFPCPAGGALYVDQDATGLQTGGSWDEALLTLQDALQVSEACEIWVAEGLYYPDEGGSQADNDRSAVFQLKNGVEIYGGFAGAETSREQRDWQTNVTVLSGDIDQNDITDPNGVITDTAYITGTNSYHVVTSSGVTETTVLDGFFITAGQANGDWPYNHGGGMYNRSSGPVLTNVTFSGNTAGYGGGMSIEDNSNPGLTNVSFTANHAAFGGGLYSVNSSESLADLTFHLNSAANQGGGMYSAYDSNLTLKNVSFTNNTAGSYGGGLSIDSSIADLSNVRFSSNHADLWGGGIFAYGGYLVFRNLTVYGNDADSGGGIYNWSSNPVLQNNILWGNTASTAGSQIYNQTSSPLIHYSLVEGGCPAASTCTHLLDVNPLFVDAANGNLCLSPGSPAIDAGNNAYITTTLDLAGGPRFVDIPAAPDTGLGTPPLVDLGAYEATFVDVGLVKTVSPLEAAPGQLITYTLTFSNGGSLPAAGVVITDAAPSFLTLQGVDFSGVLITDTGHIPPFVWAVQDLSAGQGGVITLTAILSEPLAAGVYTNTASITATEDAGVGNDRSGIGLHVLNVPPLALGDSYTTLEDTPLQIAPDSVLANDSDANGDALTAIKNSAPGHGLLTLNPDGSFVYTPTLNTNGSDSFTYRARDGALDSNIATVNLSITSVNDAPAGTDQLVTTLEDTGLVLAAANFGFTDPYDSPANGFNRVKITTLPGQGTLRLSGLPVTAGQFVTEADITAGLLTFTPVLNANGAPYTNFSFQVEDDGGAANGGVNLDPTPNTLTIHVTAENDAPIAAGDRYTTTQNSPLRLAAPGILANDTDVDSSSLTAILDSDPAHGLLSLYPNGSFVYTPTLDYHGPDSFTYHASDGVLNSDIVTVTLTVKRVYRVFLPVVQRNDGPQSNAATQRLARRNYVAAQHSRDGRSSATQLRPHPGCVRQITGDAFVERRAGGRRGGFGLSKAQHRMRVS